MPQAPATRRLLHGGPAAQIRVLIPATKPLRTGVSTALLGDSAGAPRGGFFQSTLSN